jgi:hypothetical protein
MGAERLFRLWVHGCAHVGTDLRYGRESLAEAIRHSENEFEWDIALHLGDFSGGETPPQDAEGEEVVRQLGALRTHRREALYALVGNHDASGADEPTQWWFRKWVDPTGESTGYSGVDRARVPYPIAGTWERYAFRVGNLLFLVMGDRNDGGPPVGRGPWGGYPAGAVTGETFAWWRRMVEANPDCVILSAHHHMLKETTVGSGPWEGYVRDEQGTWQPRYHRYFADGGPEGASYLYFVDGQPDSQAFERYLASHRPGEWPHAPPDPTHPGAQPHAPRDMNDPDRPGVIDLWLGGHTHTNPDDRFGGRSHVERKWGVTFVNCAALSRYHGRHNVPMSRLFTFADGSDEVRVQCYLHTSDYASQGWYAPAERRVRLTKPFRAAGGRAGDLGEHHGEA